MNEHDNQQPENIYQREPFDHKPYRNFYELLGGAAVVLALVGIGVLIFASDAPGYWQNIYITGVGAVLTVGILDRRAEQRAIRERKEELILQMGSSDNGFACEAVRLLGHKQWLYDGSLHRAKFLEANLQGANLTNASLKSATLQSANLIKAILEGANLEGANLLSAHLEKSHLDGACLDNGRLENAHLQWASLEGAYLSANLKGANLNNAILIATILEGADLRNANLQGANLLQADLRGANMNFVILIEAKNLKYAHFSEDTTLPDGSNWTPERDMREFTHPDEWRAEQAGK